MSTDPAVTSLNLQGFAVASVAEEDGDAVTAEMSPRQVRLTRWWSFYTTRTYDGFAIDWQGDAVLDDAARAQAARTGYRPFTASATGTPLALRRPTVPYHLVRLIVARFTGLLFSARRHPTVSVPDDPRTDRWLKAAVAQGRLWARFARARNYGGGQGTAVIGFAIRAGKVQFEVFDPRWCTPQFVDPISRELTSIEVKYTYTLPLRGADGKRVDARYWYRRRIDTKSDTVWPRVPYDPEEKRGPRWELWNHSKVEHGFGFVPVQWVQNEVVEDEVDGEPDCVGCYDAVEAMDRLVAQANRAIINNCGPTLHLASDNDVDSVDMSDGVFKTGGSDQAKYLEINGTGPKSAMEAADRIEDQILRTVRCVIEQARSQGARTATEVTQDTSAMYERADSFREQYGEAGIKPLCQKLLAAARHLAEKEPEPVEGEDGSFTREAIMLPPHVTKDPAGGPPKVEAQVLGDGQIVELHWPEYERPTLQDRDVAQRAAAGAAGVTVTKKTAARFVAPYFDVEDPEAEYAALEAETAQANADAMGAAYDAVGAPARAEVDAGEEAPVPDEEQPALEDDGEEPPLDAWLDPGGDGLAVDQPEEQGYGPDEVPIEDEAAPDAEVQPTSAAGAGTPQDTAMNGAQVTSMIEVVKSIRAGELGKHAAVRILMRGFAMTQPEAEDMLAQEVEGSNPPVPKAPPGGGSIGNNKPARPFGEAPGTAHEE